MVEYLVGASGWNYRHWMKRFYPEGLPRKHWFGYYSERFDTVEVNYSFYHWPREKTLRNWEWVAPKGFKYTIKAPRTITHVKKLHDVGVKVKGLYELTSLLGRKKGCHLFQLPPSFKRTEENMSRLKDFLHSLDGRRDNAVEFRHHSWWDDEVYRLLEDHKTAFVTVSGLGMPEETVVTHRVGYFRFHGGSYNKSYSDKELKQYGKKIRDAGCDRVYAYFNNDANAYAVENARTLEGMLE